MGFEQIMAAVVRGDVDAGVIIHESRFTYPEQGLSCLQDLGRWWEETTGHPIPLGGIVAKRSLGAEKINLIERCIRDSVRYAFAHHGASHNYIKQHAQELEAEVISSHIGLYVNTFSESLGVEGHKAVDFFLHLGREKGIFKK